MTKFKVMLHGFIKYKHLLHELVIRDIKVRYRKSVLGLLWTVLNPLLMMTVLTAVFSYLFKQAISNFQVYFLTGYIMFTLYSDATNQALSSIIGNAALIKKVYIPKYLFPLSRVISCLVNFVFALIAMIIVMFVTGAPFRPTIILTFIPVIYLLLFTTGLSLILSAVTVFFRDIAHLYSVFIVAWSYCTPMFYPASIIPHQFRWVLTYNPLYYYITYFRDLVLYNTIPNLQLNATCLFMGLISLTIGLIAFYKAQDKFILYF